MNFQEASSRNVQVALNDLNETPFLLHYFQAEVHFMIFWLKQHCSIELFPLGLERLVVTLEFLHFQLLYTLCEHAQFNRDCRWDVTVIL